MRHSAIAIAIAALPLAAAGQSDEIDPTLPQAERICELEIAEAETKLADIEQAATEQQAAEFGKLLGEARQFCESGNEPMAGIRLETLQALIDVTVPTE